MPEAVAASDRASTLGEALLAARGGTTELPEILARIYLNTTLLFRDTSRDDDALRTSQRALALAKQAAADRPNDLQAAQTWLLASRLTGRRLLANGRAAEALRLFEEGIAFGKARVDEHPRDIEIKLYLAALEGMLGLVEKNKGQLPEALQHYRSANNTLGDLARANPLLIEARLNWAQQLVGLSQLETDLGQYADAERSARGVIDVAEPLIQGDRSNPTHRVLGGMGYACLGKARLKAGSPREALAALRMSVAMLETSEDVDILYNLACTLALASTVSDPGEVGAADRRRRDADRAVATLRRALGRGYAFFDGLRNDPDFDPLRSRPDFQALLLDLAFPADPFAH